MRDHRISLFKAKEAEAVAEMEEKDARLDELEVRFLGQKVRCKLTVQAELGEANTSAGHQSASDRKARVALEAKVEKLEAKIQNMSSTEKELRQELQSLLKSEKSSEDSVRLCIPLAGR